MSLPYENSTSGQNAMKEAQKILQSFGASSFGYMENFEDGMLIVQFQCRSRRVEIKANAKGYAAAWLRQNPYKPRMKVSPAQHNDRALKKGQIAVYSILRDWIKGQITAIETEILSFEGAFLGQILLDDGRTVLDRVISQNLLPSPTGDTK